MSLATLKKKSTYTHGTNISGKGPLGFSLNGTVRNNTYIGKDCIRSTAGTPMNGQYPYGYGGIGNRYPTYISFNVCPDSSVGSHSIIPQKTVLTNRGMLHTRYKCIYNGTYPNNVVKNVYTGNLTDNASDGVYISDKLSSNLCTRTANNLDRYSGSPINCLFPSGVKYTYPGTFVGGYTKQFGGATDSSTYLQYIPRNCVNSDNHIPRPVYGNRGC